MMEFKNFQLVGLPVTTVEAAVAVAATAATLTKSRLEIRWFLVLVDIAVLLETTLYETLAW